MDINNNHHNIRVNARDKIYKPKCEGALGKMSKDVNASFFDK